MKMNFRDTTDELFESVSHEKLAKALGVSVATVRQARLPDGAKAHRSAPEGWQAAVLRMAKQRVDHYRRLVARLEGL